MWDPTEVVKKRAAEEEPAAKPEEDVATTEEAGDGVAVEAVRFQREDDDWANNPLFRGLVESVANITDSFYREEIIDDSQWPMWYPPHVYHAGLDGNPSQAVDSEGEMKDSWPYNGIEDVCPPEPFDVVWTFS
jgi:hypothetical protein